MKLPLKETQGLELSLNTKTKLRELLQRTGGKSPLNATNLETDQRRSDWRRC